MNQQRNSGREPLINMWVAKASLVAIVYFVVAKFSLLLAIPPGYATAVWPAAGFAIACVLLFGYKVWPGIVIGSILGNFSHSFDPASTKALIHSLNILIVMGAGASLQAVVGVYLIKKFVGYPNALLQEKDLILFLGLGGPVSCLISSTIGISTLYLDGQLQLYQAWISWATWWVGDTIGVIVFAPVILMWTGEPRKQWRQKWRATLLPFIAMFLLVVLFFTNAQRWETERANSEFIQQTDQFTEALFKNFDRHLDVIHALMAFYEGSSHVDRDEFKIFANQLLETHPGVKAMSWNPVIKYKDVNYYTQLAIKDGIQNFKIKELNAAKNLIASTRAEDHVAVYYLEPYDSNKMAIGFDISTSPDRRAAYERARDTGKPAATGRVTLVQITGKKQGFVVFLPVYKHGSAHNTEATRRENIEGYVAAGFEIQNMLREALKGISLGELRLRIFDDSAPDNTRIIFDTARTKSFSKNDEVAISRNEPFDMGGRKWRIEFSLSNGSMFNRQPWVAWSVLVGGLLFTSLLVAFLFIVTGSEARSAELVNIRTAELRESRERFELAVAGSTDGIWDWNLVTGEIYLSPRYKEIVGYEDQEFGNSLKYAMGHIHPEDVDRVEQEINNHLEKKIHFQTEFRMRKKTGDYVWILARGQALWDKNDKPLRMVGSHTDISERKEIEKMKTQFFDMISHELRTPLTPIHQFTTILQDGLGGPVTAQQKDYLDIILKNTLQLQNIIEDLVDVSRISTGKLSTHKEALLAENLSEKIIQSFSQTARSKEIDITMHIDKNIPAVWADPIRFEQVLRNLIDNAIKFTPIKGKIEVRAQHPCKDNHDFVCFSVSDTGPGIPGADKNKVFDRLYQVADQLNSSRKGLGLGLHICKEIVAQHNGQIWVESEEDKGSTFYFSLPVFSFAQLLAPIFNKTGKLPEDLGLIFVHSSFEKSIAENIKKESMGELERYLGTYILPYDVLIPGRIVPGQSAAFYLVIPADEKGVKIVTDRLQSQWEIKHKSNDNGLKITTSYRMIVMPTKAQAESINQGELMKMISSYIHLMINSVT